MRRAVVALGLQPKALSCIRWQHAVVGSSKGVVGGCAVCGVVPYLQT